MKRDYETIKEINDKNKNFNSLKSKKDDNFDRRQIVIMIDNIDFFKLLKFFEKEVDDILDLIEDRI